jgi:hypothetical protein
VISQTITRDCQSVKDGIGRVASVPGAACFKREHPQIVHGSIQRICSDEQHIEFGREAANIFERCAVFPSSYSVFLHELSCDLGCLDIHKIERQVQEKWVNLVMTEAENNAI